MSGDIPDTQSVTGSACGIVLLWQCFHLESEWCCLVSCFPPGPATDSASFSQPSAAASDTALRSQLAPGLERPSFANVTRRYHTHRTSVDTINSPKLWLSGKTTPKSVSCHVSDKLLHSTPTQPGFAMMQCCRPLARIRAVKSVKRSGPPMTRHFPLHLSECWRRGMIRISLLITKLFNHSTIARSNE